MSKKELKLTNWQVTRPPSLADFFKNAKPIDLEKYKNIGKVEKHEGTESVIEKMIAKQEAARGTKIDQEETKREFNLKGINDDRKDRKFIKR